MPEAEIIPLFQDGELAEAPGPLERQAFEIYNEAAERIGWTKATKLTPERCKKLRRAIKEVGGLIEWRNALERGGQSNFLTTKFRPDLEFVTRLPKLLKMSEGGFDDQNLGNKPTTVGVVQGTAALNWRAILETYRPGGKFWPSIQGRRPEGPGPHLAPADMVEAWRQKHGVTGMEGHNGPPQETLLDRLQGSLESYTRLGRYADANRIAERIAALTGQPAVLIPDPSVVHVGMPPKPEPEPAPPPPNRTGRWSAERLDGE